jgi:hypothetical protein
VTKYPAFCVVKFKAHGLLPMAVGTSPNPLKSFAMQTGFEGFCFPSKEGFLKIW